MSECLYHEDGGSCLTHLCDRCYAEHRELKRMLADQLGMKQEYEAKLAAKWLLEEEYEASCRDRDAMARMVDDLRSTIRTMCSLIADWRDGNSRLARPMSIADQRFLNGLFGIENDEITEVKLIVQGQRGGTATFTHWSGTATKPEEP